MAKQLKKEMSNRACLLRVGVDEDDAQVIVAALGKEKRRRKRRRRRRGGRKKRRKKRRSKRSLEKCNQYKTVDWQSYKRRRRIKDCRLRLILTE